ncbi:MAG TPA: hypothetical protein VMF11_15365 [Candidatus Baltobacteraceae bacterium]|nr:hypothetical protein [Candidatus Baltobacteraceae bacterium]
MKRLFLALTLLFAVPAVALAQQDPGAPGPAMRAQMHAQFQQIETMHRQFRAEVLGALTPAHKRLLASIAGNLAVSVNPDRRAAIAQLDAALSPAEKSAILADAAQMRGQMKTIMAQIKADHPWPHASGKPWPHRSRGARKPHAPDAGAILLGLAGGGHGMPMMGRWHQGGAPRR